MITSASNPRVKYVRRLQNDRAFRNAEDAFVVEGARWLAELTRFQVTPLVVLATDNWLAAPGNQALLTRLPTVEPVSDRVMAAMSDTATPPGVLAVAPIIARPLPATATLLLIVDQVNNPGNLGAILRTAAAAASDAVLLTPGTVDAYNPKVVRGAMGAHLRLPVLALDWTEIDRAVAGMEVWLAAASGQLAYNEVNWRRPSALIIGGEASGAGPEARHLASREVTIPMSGQTESLNAAVAAGIILFEVARQRSQPDR